MQGVVENSSRVEIGLTYRKHGDILTEAGLLRGLKSAITEALNGTWCARQEAGALRALGNQKLCGLWRS